MSRAVSGSRPFLMYIFVRGLMITSVINLMFGLLCLFFGGDVMSAYTIVPCVCAWSFIVPTFAG